nr:MAG TPA: hypothetical protein [Caudoviricetes sp.]
MKEVEIEMEMEIEKEMKCKEMKCKDCKYYQKERIPRSRSGWCLHEKWKNGCWGDHSPLIGCGTMACGDFQHR